MNSRLRLKFVISLVLISFGATSVFGQTASRLVTIESNLMILDANNAFINDIKPSDLKVFEDDVEQKEPSIKLLDGGLNLIIVVDNTGSVRERLEQITLIGRILISNLKERDEAQVIRFVGREKIEVVQAWTKEKEKLAKTMDELYVEGNSSAIIDAIYFAGENALKREKESVSKRNAIVVITDGEDRNSYYNSKQLLSLVEASDVQIFPVILSSKNTTKVPNADLYKSNLSARIEKFARDLAGRTGGDAYFFVNRFKPEAILEDLEPLITELGSQFVLRYEPTRQTNDGEPRKLRVHVTDSPKGEKRRAVAKASIILPKG